MRKIAMIALALFSALVYGKDDKCHIEEKREEIYKISNHKKDLLTFDYKHFHYYIQFDVPKKQYAVIGYYAKYNLTKEDKELPLRMLRETIYAKHFMVLDYKNMKIFDVDACLGDRITFEPFDFDGESLDENSTGIINLKQYEYCSIAFNIFKNLGNDGLHQWEEIEDFYSPYITYLNSQPPFAYTKDSPYFVAILENPYQTPKNGLYKISFYNDKEKIKIDTNFNALLQNKKNQTIAKGKWKFKNCKKGTFSVSFDNNKQVDFIKIKNPNWYKDMTLKECLK